jgi:hypothetical protein
MADELRAHAGKIDARYTEGELVRVARAAHQAEAELIQSLLLDAGVPSTVRRSAGFDVPDMLAAGPRDVLVPSSGGIAAREALLEAGLVAPPRPGERPIAAPGRILAGLVAASAVVALLVWLGTQLAR